MNPGRLLLHDAQVTGRAGLSDRSVDVRIVDGVVRDIGAGLRPSGNGQEEETIDGHGGALLPGLHDHHAHLLAMAAALRSVEAGAPGVVDRATLASALRAADRRLPHGAWLRAVGYHDAVSGPLDRTVLDGWVGNRPVRVQHQSGNLWVINSAGLQALGLPEGDREGVERDGGGTATGRLFGLDGWLRSRVDEPPPDLAPVGRLLAGFGVTGVTDATPTEDRDDVELLARAHASGALPQRVTVTGGPGLGPVDARLRRGPTKLVVADHALPELGWLAATVRATHDRGRPVAIHCVTGAALILALAALEEAGWKKGDRIEHASVVAPELVPRLRDMEITVVTQPAFILARGDLYLDHVDPADRADLYRCGSLLAAGVKVGASTDAPFGPADPWLAMAAAANRRTATGAVLGPDERVSARSALAMFLTGPDAPGGPARRLGPGVAADLCLLDVPLTEALAAPCSDHVAATIVEGTVVFRR